MAAEMAVESTVTEDNQTMLKEETSEETARDAVSAATGLADHSLKTVKEDLSEMAREKVSEAEKDAASAATDLADHSLKTAKEDLSEMVKEEVSEVEKDAASAATDLADHSLKAVTEDRHSLEKEGHSATRDREADSEIPERRASTRKISTISVTRTKAESTR